MRSRAGRGDVGESGAKRNWMFFFAERRADDDFMFAFASVEDSDMVATSASGPLEGDILYNVVQVCKEIFEELFIQPGCHRDTSEH